MNIPTISHIINLNHVILSSPKIRYKQDIIPSIGIRNPKGTLNGRFLFGCLILSIITPTETSIKAKSVPMLHKFAISSKLLIAEKKPTNTPVHMVVMWGVLCIG